MRAHSSMIFSKMSPGCTSAAEMSTEIAALKLTPPRSPFTMKLAKIASFFREMFLKRIKLFSDRSSMVPKRVKLKRNVKGIGGLSQARGNHCIAIIRTQEPFAKLLFCRLKR